MNHFQRLSNPVAESGRRSYSVRYVHKVSSRSTDTGPDVVLGPSDLVDKNALGAALRRQGALISGGRVREFRVEGNGRVVAFPIVPHLTTYWHSIIMEPR